MLDGIKTHTLSSVTAAVMITCSHIVLCTLPFASITIDNIEIISLPLDHMPDQYFSSDFPLLREVCDDQYEHTHHLVDTFFLNQRI